MKHLLSLGVIQPSQSPLSFLEVGECVDYRALNKETIKDKFSIQVVDELLDD